MIFTFNLSLNANNCIRLNNLHLLSAILTQLQRNNAALHNREWYCWHFKTFYLTNNIIWQSIFLPKTKLATYSSIKMPDL